MGVNLREIVTPEEIGMDSLAGKVIAIDALNIIYQFLSIIRDRFTGEPLKDSQGNVTSHLSGLFYRTTRMLESGITPVFVFDGKPPEFKQGVQLERHRIKEEAQAKLEEAIREGDREKIRLYAQQTSKVTDEMLREARHLLGAMGVQCVQGPSEGEAQAAYMSRRGLVYACGSQDWDSLLFGSERLIRNLASTGRRKLPGKETYVRVNPEMIDLIDTLSELAINQDQLITIGILVGTDYNPGGIKGIGPKKALQLVREKKTFENVMKGLDWHFDTPAEKIFNFFRSPPAEDVETRKGRPDAEKVKQILLGHDFSPDRINRTLEKLTDARKSRDQSDLQRFF
jgi:flap endonuclease-1